MTGSSEPEGAAREGPVLVVLAAGAGRRLGTCKALVELSSGPGSTPLELLLRAARSLPDRLVVAGPDVEAIRRRCPPDVACLENPHAAEGRTGSLACAVRAVPHRDLLVAPVDVPLVPQEVFETLLTAWRDAGAPERGWLGPFVTRERERRAYGHPVLMGRGLAALLPSWPADRPLTSLRARADPLLAVEVRSRAILDDLDTPEDLARLRRAWGKGRNGA